MPHSSRQTINAIATLLGHASQERDSPLTWAAHILGVGKEELVSAHHRTTRTHIRVIGLVLAKAMEEHSAHITIRGPGQGDPPDWAPFDVGDEESLPVPARMTVHFPPATLSSAGVCVSILDETFEQRVRVLTAGSDRIAGAELLQQLLDRAASDENPLRGRVLRAKLKADELVLDAMPTPPDRRDDLILPDEIWYEVDLCVASITSRRNTLSDLGLGTTRGLLLAGPPGVGKTNLARVLAAELAGRFTVIFADAAALAGDAIEIYDELDHIGPAVVVFEDIDLIVGHRERSPRPRALADFLSALDGAKRRHDVLTIATTNDLDAIDAAARRSARFDTVLTLPAPDAAGRTRILRRYLHVIGLALEAHGIAKALDRATGADLREVVRRAVLEHGDTFTEEQLHEVASSGRWKTDAATGQYL